ncbi:Ig-like domain-containing protein [Rahnella bruchi]|uniref:Ig-like domain-containing protein n=1 Tax=Rahnella bruchi TaxID=1510573 RepID=UPI000EA1DA47|nr:Ig-like domain-containing protein [Rahnella bruchi]
MMKRNNPLPLSAALNESELVPALQEQTLANHYSQPLNENEADTTAPIPPVINWAYDNVGKETGYTFNGDTTDDTTPMLLGYAEAGAIVKIYDGSLLIGSTLADRHGSWSFTTPVLSKDMHSLTSTATDAAGNVSAHSTTLSINVDIPDDASNVIPVINHAIDNFGDSTGTLVNNSTTDDATPLLQGSAEADSIVLVSVWSDGYGHLLGSTLADSHGNWTYDPASSSAWAQRDGTYTFSVTSEDAEGHSSMASNRFTLNIQSPDTTVPDTPDINWFYDNAGSSKGYNFYNDTTDDTTPTLIGSAEAGSIVQIYNGSHLIGSTVADASGGWDYTTPPQDDGVNSFTVTATDSAGNISAHSENFVINIVSPAPEVSGIKYYLDDSGDSHHYYYSDTTSEDTTPTLFGQEAHQSIISIYDGSLLIGSVSTDTLGSWHYTTSALDTGSHDFTITTSFDGHTSSHSADFLINIETPAASDENIISGQDDGIYLGSAINLQNGEQDTLNISLGDVFNHASPDIFVDDGNRQLAIAGDANDTVNFEVGNINNWHDMGETTSGGITYDIYQNANAHTDFLIQHGTELHLVM